MEAASLCEERLVWEQDGQETDNLTGKVKRQIQETEQCDFEEWIEMERCGTEKLYDTENALTGVRKIDIQNNLFPKTKTKSSIACQFSPSHHQSPNAIMWKNIRHIKVGDSKQKKASREESGFVLIAQFQTNGNGSNKSY